MAIKLYSLINWRQINKLFNAPMNQVFQLIDILLLFEKLILHVIYSHLYLIYFFIDIDKHAAYVGQINVRLCHFVCDSIYFIG